MISITVLRLAETTNKILKERSTYANTTTFRLIPLPFRLAVVGSIVIATIP